MHEILITLTIKEMNKQKFDGERASAPLKVKKIRREDTVLASILVVHTLGNSDPSLCQKFLCLCAEGIFSRWIV